MADLTMTEQRLKYIDSSEFFMNTGDKTFTSPKVMLTL